MQEEDIWASVALLPFSSTIAIASSNGLSVLEAALVSSSVMMNMWRTLLILFIASSIRADLHYPGDIRWVTYNSHTYVHIHIVFAIQHTCICMAKKGWNSNISNCIAVIFNFPSFWPWLVYKVILFKNLLQVLLLSQFTITVAYATVIIKYFTWLWIHQWRGNDLILLWIFYHYVNIIFIAIKCMAYTLLHILIVWFENLISFTKIRCQRFIKLNDTSKVFCQKTWYYWNDNI